MHGFHYSLLVKINVMCYNCNKLRFVPRKANWSVVPPVTVQHPYVPLI